MNPDPVDRLREIVTMRAGTAYPDKVPLEQLRYLAIDLGVGGRAIFRAAKGIPISADNYLQICAALNVDPVDGHPRSEPSYVGAILWWFLGAASRAARARNGNASILATAEQLGTTQSTLWRLEHGQPVHIEAVLKVCAYIGLHPYDYTEPQRVSRETVGETVSTKQTHSNLEARP